MALHLSYCLTALFLLWTLQGVTQSDPIELPPTPENVGLALAITAPSPNQIDTLIYLSQEYGYINQDTCLLLGKRALEASKAYPEAPIHAKSLLQMGDSYRIFGEFTEGERLLVAGKKQYELLGDEGQVAHANNKLGALSVNKGDYETGVSYYVQALETWEALADSQNIIKPYINIAAAFKNLNRLEKAESYNLKALAFADLIQDDRAKMYVFNNLGIVYNARANNYQQKASIDSLRSGILQDSATFFIQKALHNYEDALAFARKKKDKRSMIQSMTNLADVQNTMGAYRAALALSDEVEKLSEDIQAIGSHIENDVNRSETYRYLGELKKSIFYGKKALQLAEENGLEKKMASANEQLYQAYEAAGQYEKALEHFHVYVRFLQSNGDSQRNKAIAEVETKYQTVQKEKRLLKQENEILALESTNERIARRFNLLVGTAVFVGLLGLVGFLLYKNWRERKDKIAFTEALLFTQEEERKRIARDLHDGIGQTLLLVKKQMESNTGSSLANQEMITETLEEVRAISRDLHPFQLEKFGLTATLKGVLSKVEDSTDLFISQEIESIDGLLPEKADINVFRTVQEAMNNIVKHAQATAAKVSVEAGPSEIRISIQDNGIGFDQEKGKTASKSLGLRTMQERITAIGGKLTIEPRLTKGTVITCKIPIKRTNTKKS